MIYEKKMTNEDVETILNNADEKLIIIVCKNNDEQATKLIPACDRFMKSNGHCGCGADASFIYNNEDYCRECLKEKTKN